MQAGCVGVSKIIDFYKMSEKDIILLSAAVAAVLADGLSADELNTLGNFMTCVANGLLAAAGQKALCGDKAKTEAGE